ncbi:3-keto-disaccharide hydrolase [Sinomicrobium sp. M5D2P9]
MKKISYCALALVFLAGCKETNKKDTQESVSKEETASVEKQEKKKEGEWEPLFDGKTFAGWHGYNSDEISPEWSIEDGTLVLKPDNNSKAGGKNLVTDKDYTNFKLSLEWKISEGGNSGVFWGVKEIPELHEPYQTGPEVQVLDNERHPDAKAGKTHQAGALYDMVPPSENVAKVAGEWNTMVLKIDHNANEGKIWLNGVEIVKFPVHGEEWENMIKNSKFNGWEGFGAYETGKIGLQHHGNGVSFRNIKIKEL